MLTTIKYLVAISVALSVTSLQAEDGVLLAQETPRNVFPTIGEAEGTAIELFEGASAAAQQITSGAEEAITSSVEEITSTVAEESPTPATVSEPSNTDGTIATTVAPEAITNSEVAAADDGENKADPNAPIEVIEERFNSGSVKIRREMTLDIAGNYIKHGAWTQYSETDEEIAKGQFANNKREGVWTKTITWNENSLLNELPYTEFEAPFVSRAEFVNGKLNGSWTITDSEGQVASEWAYVDGKLDGQARWYYADGSVREEIDYSEGLIDGTYRLLDEDGTELTSDNYKQGRKLAIKQDLYENGAIRWEGMFLHETFVVSKADDWWNTLPVSYRKVGEPERHGRFVSWYENSQKKFEGTFEHEIRTGEFTWWHENTQVAVKGEFKDGERDGPWIWWHENGQKAIQGGYLAGALDGDWSYWSAEGKLERKVDYSGESNPVTIHSVPTTDVRKQQVAAAPGPKSTAAVTPAPVVATPKLADQPVGTGVRAVVERAANRFNPIRR